MMLDNISYIPLTWPTRDTVGLHLRLRYPTTLSTYFLSMARPTTQTACSVVPYILVYTIHGRISYPWVGAAFYSHPRRAPPAPLYRFQIISHPPSTARPHAAAVLSSGSICIILRSYLLESMSLASAPIVSHFSPYLYLFVWAHCRRHTELFG